MRILLVLLLVFRAVFADSPRLDLGWSEEFDRAPSWSAGAVVKDGVARFSGGVAGAHWSHTTEPIWLGEYPRLEMRYRAARMGRSGVVVKLRPGSVGPVTPGAANPENPFAKGMPIDAVKAAELNADGAWHLLVKDLSGLLVNPRCDQINIELAPGAELEVDYLRFAAGAAEPAPSSALRTVELRGKANTTAAVALDQLGVAKGWLKPHVYFAGVSFATGPAWTTTLRGRETLTVPIGEAATEIYLLAATRVAGSEFDPKRGAGDVERFLAEVEYDDGVVDQVFPYDVVAGAHRIADRTVMALLVPAGRGKVVRAVHVRDCAANILVALLGVTVNTGTARFADVRWAPSRDLTSRTKSAEPPAVPVTVRVQDGVALIKNRYYHCEFDLREGWSGLSSPLGPLSSGPKRLFDTASGLEFTGVTVHDRTVVATYASELVRVEVRLEADESPELRMSLAATNTGAKVVELPLRFPDLGSIKLGDAADTHYLFPRAAAVFGSEETTLEEDYSSAFPMQFVDLYNPRTGAGLYLMVKDLDLTPKRFRLEKSAAGVSLSVSYSHRVRGSQEPQHVRIEPGATFRTATTVLGFHRGDWRVAFNAYRDWVRTWYKPASARKAWFEAAYNCRRDYPLGGSGMLFDVRANRYTFPKIIDEGEREFGGIDMVDISSWAYSEKFGRVGEYTRYELGGAENLRAGITEALRRGVPTGLYLEGYLIDVRSEIGRTRARDWQIRARNQEPLAWNGAPTEVFMCPRVAEWQDWMAQTYAKVAAQTGARAFYIDEFGFSRPDRACYNPLHAHPPGATVAMGERELMRKVRAALDGADREAVIYIEEMPPDANVPYADGAFCYSINGADARRSPGAINLYRFVFPDFKLFDMVSEGIDARAMTTADMKKSFFLGNGLWLKGHAESWYPPEVREFIRRTHAVLREHSATFQSRDAEPLAATVNPAVLANRFASAGETIYTFYNEGYRTARGTILRLPDALRGREWTDLLSGQPVAPCEGGAALCMEIGPRDVAAVAARIPSHASR